MVIYNETLKQKNPGVLTSIDSQYAYTGKYDKEIEAAKTSSQNKIDKKKRDQDIKKIDKDGTLTKKIDEQILSSVNSYKETQKDQQRALSQRNELIKKHYDKNRVMDNLVKVHGSNPNGLDKESIKGLVKSQFPKQTEDYEKFKGDVVEWGVLSNIFAKMPKGARVSKELEIRANKVGMNPEEYQNNLIRSHGQTIMENVPGLLKGGTDIAKNFMKRLGQADPQGGFGGYAQEVMQKEETSRLEKIKAEEKAYERKQADKLYNYQVGRDEIIDAREDEKLNLSKEEYKDRKKQIAASFVTNLMEQIINLKGEFDFNMMGDMFSFYDSDMKDSEILLEELNDTKQLDKLFEKASKHSNGDLKKFGQYVAKFGTQYRLTPLKKEMEARWNKTNKPDGGSSDNSIPLYKQIREENKEQKKITKEETVTENKRVSKEEIELIQSEKALKKASPAQKKKLEARIKELKSKRKALGGTGYFQLPTQ